VKKYSNPLHGKSLKELEDLVSLVEGAEKAQCSFMNDMRSSGYGIFDGVLHTVEYRMILRKIELYHALYEQLGIPVPSMGGVYSALDVQGDCEYSECSMGGESEYYDDDYAAYAECLEDYQLADFIQEFTSLENVGDFKESVRACAGELPIEALVDFVTDLRAKDLWDNVSSDFVGYAAGYLTPYDGYEIQGKNISGEEVVNAVCSCDSSIFDSMLEYYDDDSFLRLNELYYVRSKKLGAATSIVEAHVKEGTQTPEDKLFLEAQEELANVYLVTCSSCRWENGLTESGEFYSAFVSLADAESDEGDGVPLILRHLPVKFYGIVCQELADRILSAEKKKRKEVKPEINVRVKTV
jgi:hypothetical protein